MNNVPFMLKWKSGDLMAWITHSLHLRNKVWRDDANPRRFAMKSSLAPMNYESEAGSGVFDSQIDMTPNRVDNALLDGWTITANGWHYAMGVDKVSHPNQDGWFAFGGRRGQAWAKFRLLRFGYLRWSTKAWTDVGGAPTYVRAGNLSQQAHSILLEPDDQQQTISTISSWRNIWTPGGGECWIEAVADGDRLKINPVLNQAARNFIATQYPGGQQTNHYFGFVFHIDFSGIPRILKNGQLQSLVEFDDDNGTSPITGEDALNRLLFMLPVDDAYVRDPLTNETLASLRLRKRIYTENGQVYLLVGARVDLLNALPQGDLIFDPTINPSVSAGNRDANERSDDTTFSSVATTVRCDSHGSTPFSGEFIFTATGPASGNTVDVCYVTVTPGSGTLDDANVDIHFEDVDDAADFTANADIINRTRTASSVQWSQDNLGTSPVNSPSLVTPAQVVINRAGWASGNEMGVIFKGRTNATKNFRPFSYDNGSGYAALYMEYTAGAAPEEGAISLGVSTAITDSGQVNGAGLIAFAVSSAIADTGQAEGEGGVTLDALMGISGVGSQSVDASISLEAVLLVLQSSDLSLNAALSLNVINALANVAEAEAEAAISLDLDQTIENSGQAEASAEVSLDLDQAVTNDSQMSISAEVSLDLDQAITNNSQVDISAEVPLSFDQAIVNSGQAEAEAEVPLSFDQAITNSGQAEALADLILNVVSAVTQGTGGTVDVSLSLGVGQGISATGTAEIDGSIILTFTPAILEGADASAEGALTLIAELAQNYIAEAIASANLSLNVVVTITTNYSTVVVVFTPKERRFAINYEDRYYAINKQGRSFAINFDDRTLAINRR